MRSGSCGWNRGRSRSGRARSRAGGALAAGVVTAGLFTSMGCAPLSPGAGLAAPGGPISDQWVVRWDPEFRTPAQMINRSLQEEEARGLPAISESQADSAVRAVLHEYHDWFRLRPDDDFRVVRSHATGWLRFLRIVQTYKGVPVAGGGYDARVLPGGRVASLEGRFHPGIVMSVIPALSPHQAEARALADLAGNPTAVPLLSLPLDLEADSQGLSFLTVLPRDYGYVLAWGIEVRTPPPQAWRVYVDAAQGSLLGRQPLGSTWGR